TGWYPTALETRNGILYIANNKGAGSRSAHLAGRRGWNSYNFFGSLQAVKIPGAHELSSMSATVMRDLGRSGILESQVHRGSASATPKPLPTRLGSPSIFHHVIYVIRENRTYDQVL